VLSLNEDLLQKCPGKINLREWLFRMNISVTNFALLAGIHRCYVHDIISGRRKPSDALSKRIAKITMNKVFMPKRSRNERR